VGLLEIGIAREKLVTVLSKSNWTIWMADVRGANYVLPGPAPRTIPARAPQTARCTRSSCLPLLGRDITVPTGIPNVSWISL
jgi:hypothetical protein